MSFLRSKRAAPACLLALAFCLTNGASGQAPASEAPPAWTQALRNLRYHPFEVVSGLYYFTDRGNWRWDAGLPPRFSEDLPARDAIDFGRKLVFTFDDVRFGPSLDDLLGLLERRGVKAVFFLTESHMLSSADEATVRRQLRRMLELGHELGNHTAGHPNLDAPLFARSSGPAGLEPTRAAFSRLEDLVGRLLGEPYPMRWLRPPFGLRGNGAAGIGPRLSLPGRVDQVARERGQHIILWHINSLDFQLFESPLGPGSPGMGPAVHACLGRIAASPGGVVLFHANQLTPALVEGVLDGLELANRACGAAERALALTGRAEKLAPWRPATVAELMEIKYGSSWRQPAGLPRD